MLSSWRYIVVGVAACLVSAVNAQAGISEKLISDVPAYGFYRGSGHTAAASVIGYYDLNGFPNLFDADGWEQVRLTANVRNQISSPEHNAKYDPHPDNANLPVPPNTSIACWFQTSVDPLPFGWSNAARSDDAFIGYTTYRGYECTSFHRYYGALSWSDITDEIDAMRPMVFLVDIDGDSGVDHFVPVFGYDDRGAAGKFYACYDGWSETETVVWKEYRPIGDPWGVGYVTFAHITPEPATLSILALGAMAMIRRRRRARQS